MMDWKKLLSHKRLGGGVDPKNIARTPDLRDMDRIVFSAAFRRLQDKTQVFPLPLSDYVRTRLTHSIESSCVGRSLGAMAGKTIIQRHKLRTLAPMNFGITVGVACLAHDIGNPPFGHSGEDAIQYWFRTSTLARGLLNQLNGREQGDFWNFEGNAQGFRILARLQNAPKPGGLQLTCATLGAFTKYPRESVMRKLLRPVSMNSGEVHMQLLPERYRRTEDDLYKRLLCLTDYISGMTDSFAVALYKKIKGISLPSN